MCFMMVHMCCKFRVPLRICVDISAIVYVMVTDYNIYDRMVPISTVSPHYLMPTLRIMSLLFLDCIRGWKVYEMCKAINESLMFAFQTEKNANKRYIIILSLLLKCVATLDKQLSTQKMNMSQIVFKVIHITSTFEVKLRINFSRTDPEIRDSLLVMYLLHCERLKLEISTTIFIWYEKIWEYTSMRMHFHIIILSLMAMVVFNRIHLMGWIKQMLHR